MCEEDWGKCTGAAVDDGYITHTHIHTYTHTHTRTRNTTNRKVYFNSPPLSLQREWLVSIDRLQTPAWQWIGVIRWFINGNSISYAPNLLYILCYKLIRKRAYVFFSCFFLCLSSPLVGLERVACVCAYIEWRRPDAVVAGDARSYRDNSSTSSIQPYNAVNSSSSQKSKGSGISS